MIVAGLEMLREICRQPAFRDLWNTERLPDPDRLNGSDLREFARTRGGTAFHPASICRMGGGEHSVVESELRVRGVERLRVIDASVMPSVTSANTSAANFMIAESGAELVLRVSGGA